MPVLKEEPLRCWLPAYVHRRQAYSASIEGLLFLQRCPDANSQLNQVPIVTTNHIPNSKNLAGVGIHHLFNLRLGYGEWRTGLRDSAFAANQWGKRILRIDNVSPKYAIKIRHSEFKVDGD